MSGGRARRAACLLAMLLLIGGCGGERTAEETNAGDPVSRALAADARPATDRARDAARRPGEVLAFFGVEPGMTVLDVFSGGGYYTEIAARIVGPAGRVIAHNNRVYLDYAAEEIAARYADGRLANVERIESPVTELAVEPGSVDVALLILAYHDVYFRPDDGSWPRIDGPAMLARIRDALRPGGVLGVVDHAGSADITTEEIGRLHRIDETRLVREIESAGFELAASSDVLRNPDDNRLLPMFHADVRGRTDRLVLKFRKPE